MSSPIQFATTSDGVRIAYASFGNGQPLVFASNIFGDLAGYRSGGPHLREVTDRLVDLGWRVIRYDVRGMGLSARNVEDLSLERRVRDLAAVVGQLRLDRFNLAGLDIGAATAVAYAAQNRTAVSSLVLLSPWPSGARYLQIPELIAAYSAEAAVNGNRKLFANILLSVATKFQDGDLVHQGTQLFVQATSPEGLIAYNAANGRIDLTALLPRLKVPTLVIHESAFPFGWFQLCQEVAAGIEGSEFVIVGDNSIAGRVHDETVTAIDQFLRSGTVN